MKKFLLLVPFLLAFFLVGTQESYASNFPEEGVTIYKKEKIEDDKLLLERAEKGITDKENNSVEHSGILTNLDNNVSTEISILETTELLEEKISATGDEIKTYATTYFAPIREGDLEAPVATPASGGSWGGNDKYDSTLSVYGRTTIYFSEVTDSKGLKYLKWNRQVGTWQAVTSGITYSNRSVLFKQIGYPFGGGPYGNPSTTRSVAHSYDVNVASFGWPAVVRAGAPGSGFSATPKITLKRGSSSWVFQFTNSYTF